MASLQTLHSRAQALDAQDPLAIYRQQFHIPRRPDGQPVIYLCGNSLGLQPVAAQAQVQQIMNDWATQAVSAYAHAPEPWMTYADSLKPLLMPLVGATAPEELAILNTLSVNLHLLLVSFYAPTATRFKIVVADRAFPSDRYVVESHLRTRGLDPADALVVLRPAHGDVITPEDVARVLATEGDHVALWLLGGVNYYTGQWFDIPGITQLVQASGARIGWDLAHAVGNVPLALSEWGVDFAAWCHYKYVNGGPTCPGAIYIHPKHLAAGTLPRYEGWWGNHPQSRFLMRDTFEPAPGADAWVHSIPALLHLACMRAALALFVSAGIPALRQKSLALTALLEEGIGMLKTDRISIITPKDPNRRGAQLSLRVAGADRSLFDRLTAAHVVADWREPDTIRVAPVPLYNSYADVAHFVQTLQDCL
jgi:kynureninase